MARNGIVEETRREIYRRIKELRETDLTINGIPSSDFLDFLRCTECEDYVSTRPLNVHQVTKGFLCKDCVTTENRHLLVMIPSCYLAEVRFPCRYCEAYPYFGDSWKMHVEMCEYHNLSLIEAEDIEDSLDMCDFEDLRNGSNQDENEMDVD